VWLNAGSSIRFPVVFDKSERRVEITGEAYFEVAERKTQPFIVKTKNQTVEVLGTWFNINAYDNEDAEKTTLLKGSVRVEANSGKTEADVVLKPGQQAVLAHQFPAVVHHPQVIGNSSGIKVQNIADLKKVVAWKDGLFDFSNASLEEVMRQLARWYDINVKFEGDVPDIEFAGRVGRDVSLSRMLVFFKESGVNFRMENGNTLIIGKK
ncbi:MAG TPA: FecR domain-containing protein, partial [Parasegetibacter sp.]